MNKFVSSGCLYLGKQACVGINCEGASLGADDLYAYAAFTRVAGIGSAFTVTCELRVTGTTS